jgi:elongation factor 1-gamma
MTGQTFEVVVVDDKMRKSDAYKKLTTTDKFPMLQTDEGCLHESTAICKYLCTVSKKLLGSNAVERSQVDQWVAYCNTQLFPTSYTVYKGIFGWAEVDKADWDQAGKDLKAHAKTLNTALEGKKYLVGNSVSLADLVVASMLQYAFQTTLDGGFRKAMKNLEPWAQSIYGLKEFKSVHGQTQLCAKPLKPVVKEAPKEPKKKAEPAAAKPKEEKKEEKKLDNV